jgi:hypothetical protein
VRNQRGYGRPQLYIFEVAGIDGPMTGREVIVWWFVSGRRAYDIVKYYTAKLCAAHASSLWPLGMGSTPQHLQTASQQAADELEILCRPKTAEDRELDPEQSEENLPDPLSLRFTSGAEFRLSQARRVQLKARSRDRARSALATER